MLQLACKDMGSTDCSFVATDESMDALLAKMKAHAMADHPEKMKEMAGMSEADMMEMMKKAVKTV